jgi:hypothetical protein
MTTKQEMIEKELITLAKDGRLTPEDVVKSAARKTSPLHEYFEWDEKKAAKKYRLMQARQLIRSVTIHVTRDEVEIKVPRFVRDPDMPSEMQGYYDVKRMDDANLKRRALDRALYDGKCLMNRAHKLAKYFGFHVDDIARIETELADMGEEFATVSPEVDT